MLETASLIREHLAGPFIPVEERNPSRRTAWRSRLTLLEQADTGPRTVSRGPFLLRQASQQSEEERRSLESRRGFQQPFHINRLPRMRQEKSRPLRRTEFEWRADGAEFFSSCALHHAQESRRGKVHDPALKMSAGGEVLGKGSRFFGAVIDEQTFRENQDSVGAAIEVGK